MSLTAFGKGETNYETYIKRTQTPGKRIIDRTLRRPHGGFYPDPTDLIRCQFPFSAVCAEPSKYISDCNLSACFSHYSAARFHFTLRADSYSSKPVKAKEMQGNRHLLFFHKTSRPYPYYGTHVNGTFFGNRDSRCWH